ncbi:MAG: hypothetical protein Q7T03_09175 [Deltaproteobacteria bacterium]|nr:hypothetical protein [Deltaproteobacteria bacterium]
MTMPILKLDKDDPQKELEFEVKCGLAIRPEDRIHKLLEHTKAMLRLAKRYEDRRPSQIIKRKAG